MRSKGRSEWFSKNTILRPNSIVTQLKFAPPPQAPFLASVLTHVRGYLPHSRLVLDPTLERFLEHAQSLFRPSLIWTYVKMAASALNLLLRRLPSFSSFRGAYGVQVTP